MSEFLKMFVFANIGNDQKNFDQTFKDLAR